jgi:hypothetical protein
LKGQIDCISETALGFEVTNWEKEGRYALHKTIIGDPNVNCMEIVLFVTAELVIALFGAPMRLARDFRA